MRADALLNRDESRAQQLKALYVVHVVCVVFPLSAGCIETKSSALVRCSMGSVADSSAAKIRF